MTSSRSSLAPLWLVSLTICGIAAVPSPAGAQSAAEGETTRLEAFTPTADPMASLQKRWRAPFAVISRGRPVPHTERIVVVPSTGTGEVATAEPSTVETSSEPPATPKPRSEPAPARAAAASSRPAGNETAERMRTHKVEWGETWYGIARRYAISPSAMEAANPGVEPGMIRSGQVLRIPSGSRPAPTARTHQVGAGDTLWGIARRYGVSMERIRAVNGLRDDHVRLGQTLRIPEAEESR